MATKHFIFLSEAAGALALALMLVACSGDGDSRAELRKLAGVTQEPAQTSSPSPQAESTEPTQIIPTAQPAQVLEVTREVVQPVEVTRIVEVTPTPDIAGFTASPPIDESVQPCPKPFWKRGKCHATQKQIDDYARESVQP